MTSFDCVDCWIDTSDEYYMVNDFLWLDYGAGDGMLCIGCLEQRIGRLLVWSDFIDAPINYHPNGWDKSERLVDRLSGWLKSPFVMEEL